MKPSRIITTHKSFKCEECDYKTRSVFNLKRHQKRVHIRDCKTHRCTFDGCTYESYDKRNLYIHQCNKHTRKDPFECDRCLFSCRTFNTLKKHRMLCQSMPVISERSFNVPCPLEIEPVDPEAFVKQLTEWIECFHAVEPCSGKNISCASRSSWLPDMGLFLK